MYLNFNFGFGFWVQILLQLKYLILKKSKNLKVQNYEDQKPLEYTKKSAKERSVFLIFKLTLYLLSERTSLQ